MATFGKASRSDLLAFAPIYIGEAGDYTCPAGYAAFVTAARGPSGQQSYHVVDKNAEPPVLTFNPSLQIFAAGTRFKFVTHEWVTINQGEHSYQEIEARQYHFFITLLPYVSTSEIV